MFEFWFRLPFRFRLGVAVVLLLVIAGVLGYVTISDPVHHPINKYSGILKIAPILFLFWLAWRDLVRIPFWVYIVSFPVLMLCLLRPWAFLYVVPIVFIAIFISARQHKQ
ncbi:MAG: hypothetical protein LBT09_02330 [Planctomycetaceae bacterium]|nr:hypothetical protein [Planctomycetaceae bacterium]